MSEYMARCFRAHEAGEPPFGRPAGGSNVFAPFRPAVSQLSVAITPFLDGKATEADAPPIPRGMTIYKSGAIGQIQLILPDTYTRHMRRVYGFIGELKLSCA